MFGSAVLKLVRRGQAVIALVSTESEFHGLTTAASESLGGRFFAVDLGLKLGLSTSMDALAGAASSTRRGIGRVKHLATLFLWVQDFVTRGDVKITKLNTSVNVSNILTKSSPSNTI